MELLAIITYPLSFLYAHFWLVSFLSLIAAVVFWIFFSNQDTSPSSSICNTPENGSTPRRVSVIREIDENDPTKHSEHLNEQLQKRRMRKRDWAKKIYRSFMQSDSTGRSTPSDDVGEDRERRKLSRRHSTANPLQMARELIKRGRTRYFRQNSEINREALPRPPMEFFEPADLPEIPQNLKPEVFYVLHNLKMLELPAQWRLDPKDINVSEYAKDQYIIRPGDDDDSMFVPIEGTLAVYIACNEGKDSKEYLVKKISQGSAFFSLLSMLDILMNCPSVFKTVSVKAIEPSKVAQFSIRCFVEAYKQDPQAWSRPIQIVCTRLLHVTMTTLHNYMGLSSELMKPRLREPRPPANSIPNQEETRRRYPSDHAHPRPPRAQSLSRKPVQSEFLEAKPEQQFEMACRWLAEALQLKENEDWRFLQCITIQKFEEGDTLVEQGSEEEQLGLVLTGQILMKQDPVFEVEDDDTEAEEKWTAVVNPRELIGGLQVLTNEPSFYTYKAKTDVTIAILQKHDIVTLIERRPMVYLPIAHSVLSRLSPFVRGVDFALDWVLLDSGQAAYRAGDIADSLFVVLSGRLRSVEKKTVIEEFGRGDVLGMIELLQKKPRSTTVLAVRFSQLARVPEGLLNFIKLTFPQVGFRLVQLLGQYYTSSHRRSMLSPPGMPRFNDQPGADPMSHIKNLHTIAVVPASSDVPLTSFTCELYHTLNVNCRVLRLSSQKVASCLDAGVLEKQADFRLMHWLNVQEDTYPLVIYECLRQADAILVVGIGTQKPPKQSLLDEVLSMNQQDGLRTNKELILLWPENTAIPSGTYEWLKGSYFSGHHHIRAPARMFLWKKVDGKASLSESDTTLERDVIGYYEQHVFWEKVDFRCDFARLARILTGNAIGLVLGGGGARGAAHVGVIRAMRELGIPVDVVGGTSIGSMIGGIFAETPDPSLELRAKSWFMVMCSLWRKIWDLTYAHTAMFTGAGFNQSLSTLFGDREIEDLWIPYFCISTDISTSEMRVHRSGRLWTYARASMSLAGYLPPICDPRDGHHLLDGGYVNNLPADVMRFVMGTRVVIAVDVGSVEETNLFNYGDSLSGTSLLFRKFNPWAEPIRILNMEEIQTRLAFVSCVRQLETVKKASYCCYLRPPIEPFKTLDFAKFDLIAETGYKYGTSILADLMLNNENLREALGGIIAVSGLTRQQSRKERRLDRSITSSFTDLAAALSKVPTFGRRRNSMSAMDQFDQQQMDEILEDLMCSEDSENEFGLSSEFGDTSEAETEPPMRMTTPRPKKI
ncbi:unnamed protein product, partial [Mesorhabditis belari]|uniref:Neuropathy target esterase sws n=1 Tax=Mesorhabditis belari TaxID=2138241 RepID=A0AAF3E805_9BILA